MKLYYTLVQNHRDDHSFRHYLNQLNIRYHMSTDFDDDLEGPYFTAAARQLLKDKVNGVGGNTFLRTFVILADDADMTAMRLAYPEVWPVRNRAGLEFKNRIRKFFYWFKQ